MASRTSLRWWSPATTSWLLIRTLWPSWSSRITTDSPQCPNSNQKTLTMSSHSSQTVCTCRIRTWPLKDSGYTGRHGKARCLYPELVHYRESCLCWWIPEVKACCPPPSASGCLPAPPLPAVTPHSYTQGAIPSSHTPLWAQDLRLPPGLTLHPCFDTGLSDTRVTGTPRQ